MASARAILKVNPRTHTAERQRRIGTPRISQRDAAAATTTSPRSRGHGMQRRNLARYRILFIYLSLSPSLAPSFSVTATTVVDGQAGCSADNSRRMNESDESDDTDTADGDGTARAGPSGARVRAPCPWLTAAAGARARPSARDSNRRGAHGKIVTRVETISFVCVSYFFLFCDFLCFSSSTADSSRQNLEWNAYL